MTICFARKYTKILEGCHFCMIQKWPLTVNSINTESFSSTCPWLLLTNTSKDIDYSKQWNQPENLPWQLSTLSNRPATIHWCTAIFFATIWTSYIEQAIAIYLLYIYICINKHGKALSSIISAHPPSTLVLMLSDFLNKLMRKIHAKQCLALYSRWRTQQTHASFQLGLWAVQTSEPKSKTQGNTILVLLLYNVSYRVSYRDNCIEIRILSYRAKMYCCRPTIKCHEYMVVEV